MLKISLRKKIFLLFLFVMAVNGLIWFVNAYYESSIKQKLQIIDHKNNLLNIILEARRYEKNFFLHGNTNDLQQAISYMTDAEDKLKLIIQQYGQYTLTHDFGNKLDDMRAYRAALVSAMNSAGQTEGEISPKEIEDDQKKIQPLGSRITNDIDHIVHEERLNINQLLDRSRIDFIVTMTALLMFSILTIGFLIVDVNGPLKSIENAIQKIAVGDYTTIPTVRMGYEFESLVSSLNDMINELNRRSEHLVQIEKLASLGTLTSGVAHELNNPLNNISTSVQILLEELEEADMAYKRELLTETESQVDRARDIVRALLEFSRQTSFNRKMVHMKSLVEKTIRLIKSEVPDNVEIHTEIPEDIEASIDPQRIQQVLINLVINAIHAMKDGGVVNILSRPISEDSFSIQVRDTGTGISEENLPRIFDPFFTTKEVGKGSGLGLSISHGIIEQHGGRIEVESISGAGTTFTIQLPTGLSHEN